MFIGDGRQHRLFRLGHAHDHSRGQIVDRLGQHSDLTVNNHGERKAETREYIRTTPGACFAQYSHIGEGHYSVEKW